MIKRPKIAIVGAGGNVGAAVAQWAAQKELGELVLIDIKPGPAEGRALDLTQCGPWEGFNNTRFVATDKAEAMAGADVVVMLSLIHISEPTRLLSISYAVFCLKKKK